MRAALVLIALAAGCYNDTPGMRLVIRDPDGKTAHVELFLSTRVGDTDRIGANVPRSGEQRSKHRGATFFLDGPSDGITPLTRLDMTGDQVVWDLRADGDADTTVKLLVAVGFDENDTAVSVAMMPDVTVPAHDTVATVLQLQSALELPPSEARMPGGYRVWAWRKQDAAAAACLAVEDSTSTTIQRWWLVPEDDPDCDEVQLECDEHLYRADYSSNSELCIVPAATGANHLPCRIGQKFCQDEVSAGQCTPSNAPTFCLANAFCDPDACLQDIDQCEQSDTSRVDCDMALQQDGTLCPELTPGGTTMTVTLSTSLFPAGCQSVAFATMTPTGYASSPMSVINDATFTIEGFTPASCTFKVLMSGTYDAAAAGDALYVLPLDIVRGTSHLVLPFFLEIKLGTCDDRTSMCSPARSTANELSSCQ